MKPSYKCCAVPLCKNTSLITPDKLFINVPSKPDIRVKWLKPANKDDIHQMSIRSKMYFCEDHFDLPNDMENYLFYHVLGAVSNVRMKPGCIPTRFDCQLDRRTQTSNTTKTKILKKQSKMLKENIGKDFADINTSTKHLESAGPSSECSGTNLYRFLLYIPII